VVSDPGLVGYDAPTLLWDNNGRLIFAMQEPLGNKGDANLWRIAVDPRSGKASASAAKMTNWYGVFPRAASLSSDGNRLAVWKTRNWSDVYITELKDNGTRGEPPRRLTISDTRDLADGWTPDSKSILFESDRTGRIQIFKQQLDLDAAEPLTQGTEDKHGAKATPDGAWIL
jgi:Tol biopolymer transport system component